MKVNHSPSFILGLQIPEDVYEELNPEHVLGH